MMEEDRKVEGKIIASLAQNLLSSDQLIKSGGKRECTIIKSQSI